jgi:uncharacterized protein (TIGR02145 family)
MLTYQGFCQTDQEGKTFKTKKIGNQEWMAENLNVSHYRNGDPISQVQDKNEWSKLTTGAWCYYENNSEYGKIYGKLYNWYAVNDLRGLAPEGWHIPSDAEWTQLIDYLGGEKVAGDKLKATTLWEIPNSGATNSSGFSAFPGGSRSLSGGVDGIGKIGCFWSSSEGDYSNAWDRSMSYYYSDVYRNYPKGKINGFSCRCVRD